MLWIANKEVKLLSEKSREEEKLSFKEQILRDLERVRERERRGKEDESPTTPTPSSQVTPPAPSEQESNLATEDLMADSLSTVDEILKNAPSVPPRPSFESSEVTAPEPEESKLEEPAPAKIDAVEPKKEEKEFNTTPTKVAVSYKTDDNKEESVPPVVENVVPAPVEQVDDLANAPLRSRREGTKPAKKKKKSKAKGCLLTFLVFLVLVGIGGFFGYGYVQDSLKPVDASSKDYVKVQIPEGSNIQEIGSTLEKSGLVKHGLIFSLYAKYKSADLKSGYYNLKKSMSTDELIQELQKGGTPEPQEPALASLTIPEGYTLEQIAQTVGQLQGEFKEPLTADAFLAKAQDETFISQLVAKYPNLLGSLPTKDSGVRYRLEGYLFPATYTIKDSTTVESLIDEMLAAMDKALSPYYATIKEKNLTVNELLSIASLV